MDRYYATEKPIPSDLPTACRVVRAVTRWDKKAVETVLSEFFIKGALGWSHCRCDTEIEAYRLRSDSASRAAKTLWKQRIDQANAGLLACGTDANQEPIPITNNQEPPISPAAINVPPTPGARRKASSKGKESPEFLAFWARYPRHDGRAKAWEAWRKVSPMPEPGVIRAGLLRAIASEQWQRDGGRFIPLPATWLNQRRWEDEGTIPLKPLFLAGIDAGTINLEAQGL